MSSMTQLYFASMTVLQREHYEINLVVRESLRLKKEARDEIRMAVQSRLLEKQVQNAAKRLQMAYSVKN